MSSFLSFLLTSILSAGLFLSFDAVTRTYEQIKKWLIQIEITSSDLQELESD
jgi:hypothetical protein